VKFTPRRIAAVAALAVAGVLALGACNTSPGAAAIVGGHNIGVAELSSYTDGLGHSAGKSVATQRDALSKLIVQRVVASAAHRHGVHATRGQVQREFAKLTKQAGGKQALAKQAKRAGIPPDRLRTFVRDDVLQTGLAHKLLAGKNVSEHKLHKLYQQNIAQFTTAHVAHILVKDKKAADKILAKVKKHPKSFAKLAKKDSIDKGSAAKGGDLGTAPLSSYVQPFAQAILKAKKGSYVEAHSRYGWHVIHVISKDTKPFKQVKGQLRQQVLGPQSQQQVGKALTREAKRLDITVNPRFGRWDYSQEKVIARKSGVSKPAGSAGSGSPSSGSGG
jgi:peptidyl-prolyl cis-trans isomerase C